MSNLKEIIGFYGSGNTPCNIFVYTQYNGSSWYCVEDSCNVNCTFEDLEDGCNVEDVSDFDTATSTKEIETLEELENFIDNE